MIEKVWQPIGSGPGIKEISESRNGFFKGVPLADAVRAVANAEDLDFHRCKALFDEAEFTGYGCCDIQHSSGNEWAAVVQADCG